MTAERQEVRTRRVFYIPGYDPIHPRRYRELYRKEGAAQAEISGYDLSLAPKTTSGPYGWQATGHMDGTEVTAEIEVLVWSDIVRTSMSSSIPATYAQLVRTAWTYIASGALRRLMLLRKGPVIAALYPVGFLLVQALVALLAGLGVLRLFAPFFFQAEDGIRVSLVTGVQTCALPICTRFFFKQKTAYEIRL